ncbi:FCS-Like Zinc finger 8-like [Actinidia eriantha]|uniref:FCS-Like Zinc finger 8-like n=1 Tax=Actinidia eriantha TaxID=165200 RepID=UPI002585ECB2|nr:FCS-Like Zinc finger 8-like [Actinidia eriantha]XP_057508845.1 FCS-Like Zinc finger 8-like [Actinidia eriantha]XP_057508846.1 FCS-Like Zinc finger 8-like [Actinidia eriantha]
MLRNRSRALTTKQALMADQSSLSPLSQNQTRPISSLFNSPRFFNGFLTKSPSETPTISPNSILDTNPPFGYDKTQYQSRKILSGNKQSSENRDRKGIALALALVDSLNDEKTDEKFPKPNSRMVLFGSNLKIQIPKSPNSPSDFGIKTRDSQFLSTLSPYGSLNSSAQTQAFSGFLSPSEMELSEDYTCVISHGPNPKTTHIYDNCVVESCGVGVGISELKRELSSSENSNSPPEMDSFLSLCCTCKKSLEQGKDIYMYKGEKSFCSSECRYQEMLFDEVENPGIL